MADELDKLTRKLGLLQSVGKDAAKKWAKRTREIKAEGKTWDQAAIMAASGQFIAEFKATRYNYGDDVEALLKVIEAL